MIKIGQQHDFFLKTPESTSEIDQVSRVRSNGDPFHIYYGLGLKCVVSSTRRVGGSSRHVKSVLFNQKTPFVTLLPTLG